MEYDKALRNPEEGSTYEKPQFFELASSIVFGLNPESGGRDDGGEPEGEGEYSDGY